MTHRPLIADASSKPVGFDDWTKTAGTRLSADARLWQTEIVAQLAAAHPYLPVEDLNVEFNRIDPVKGAAVGSVKVGASGVTIPLVVKRMRTGSDPELMPTDIFYADGRYQPMTPDNVKAAMQSREIGEPLRGPATGRAVGGNPYIGDLTGDASPLEFAGQVSPAAGPFATKTSAVSAKNLPDAAKGAVMGALAFGGHRALRELEIQNRGAQQKGKTLTTGQKAKAIGKGAITGAAVGGVAGAAATHAAKKMDIESPFVKKHAGINAPSVRELVDGAVMDPLKMYRAQQGLIEGLAKSAQIHPNDLANFRALLATNPQVLQGAAASNLNNIDMLLKNKGPGAAVPGARVTRPNVMILMKDPLTGMTRVKFTGGPSETIRNEDELKAMLRDRYEEAKASLLNFGAYVVADDIVQATWDASRQDASGAKPVERDGVYAIRDRTGAAAIGNVAMQMIRPNGQALNMRLFVTDEGRFAVSPELYGVRIGGRNRFKASKAKQGAHGVFVTYTGGTPVATTPVIVDSVATLTGSSGDVKGDDFIAYNVTDPMTGEKMSLVPSRSVQCFVRLHTMDSTKLALTHGDVYLMPGDADWVDFTGRIEVARSADQVVKISAFTDDVRATKIAFIDGGFRIEQIDCSWQDLEQIGAYELLAAMGITKAADLRDVCDQARGRRGESVAINGLHAPELIAFSVKEAEEKTFPLMTKLTQAMRPAANLIKAAAATGDDQALDVVLGLNFITPQNVRVFTDSIDQFDEVASKLASLLLASRLGLQHVREDAVKEAMEGIARTSEQLRLLQSAAQFKRQDQAPGP